MWDYPRPPRIEPVPDRVTVEVAGRLVADTTRALRVLETSQAPAYYVPPEDVDATLLRPSATTTACEWKGVASYVDVVVPGTGGAPDVVVRDAGWCYRHPVPAYAAIRDHLAFYAQRVDRCTVGDEVVSPNDGDFYGGWITSRVVGPFKGGPGTRGW